MAGDDHRDLRLELDIAEGAAADDGLDVGRAAIEANVRRMNGFGRLRWGRTFEGARITNIKTIDFDGKATTIVFIGPAVQYLLPEDWIAGAEARGIPRARLPVGMAALADLDGVAITTLASADHHVALVLRLVDEMLAW